MAPGALLGLTRPRSCASSTSTLTTSPSCPSQTAAATGSARWRRAENPLFGRTENPLFAFAAGYVISRAGESRGASSIRLFRVQEVDRVPVHLREEAGR